MTLALQALPLLLLLALLGSGRATPAGAALVALLATLPALLAGLPDPGALPGVLAEQVLRGAFLGLQPVAVVTGGLLFHAAVTEGDAAAGPQAASPARAFAVTLPLGIVLESVTGFAVGAVFALSSLRRMGLGGAPAGALALLALVMVPWGGLAPGTALGAAMAGVPAEGMSMVAAWLTAAWLLLLAPLLWSLLARAGLPVPGREKAAQAGMLAALGGLLVAGAALLPFELVGLVASAPVVLLALWRANPLRDPRAALGRAAPYLLLTAALLAARLWPGAPAWRPFAELPPLPLSHVAVVLWLVAGALLLARRDGLARAGAALRRARRPAIALLLYVLLGRLLAGSGAAAGLATAASEALGPLAPFAVAPIALLSGLITGSNVGSNAALMPVQVALGAAAGLPPLAAPAVQNFAGAAGVQVSLGVTAMLCGLLADGTRPAQLWRLLWPSPVLVLGLGWAATWLLRGAG
ncbi:L-lactate permease [Paracraurococcus lichenis]|uniref:L-lactate permease n=1 Tax=Paracraurococcus lichenis TaxID=3064888 RepID=A0ABT9E0A8_9PROT|nr:L-lactate permease [Paracraurococcus sp. LOR1-02]MDO9709563.1 L-lactate permease [Paracraurococcus sp. LOR1-02]